MEPSRRTVALIGIAAALVAAGVFLALGRPLLAAAAVCAGVAVPVLLAYDDHTTAAAKAAGRAVDPGQELSVYARVPTRDHPGLLDVFDRADAGRITVGPDRLVWAPDDGPPVMAPLRDVEAEVDETGVLVLDIGEIGRWYLRVSDRRLPRVSTDASQRARQRRTALLLVELIDSRNSTGL